MKHDGIIVRNTLSEKMRARPRNRPSKRRDSAIRLVALDSDGTFFDSLTPKHERCFMPAFASFFGSGADRRSLDEIWRFVNLESRLRGAHRYMALAAALRIGARHPRVGAVMRRREGVAAALEAWLAQESTPSKSRLELALAAKRVDRLLAPVLDWSQAVDEAIAGLPLPRPFRGALSALPLLVAGSELMVLTASPAAAVMEGRFESEHVLVVGDAPGDLESARAAGAQFFPVLPGREEESWQDFRREFLPRFLAGKSPRSPIAAFLDALPQDPPW